MRVGIASDHGGYALKETMIADLRAEGHDVQDFGPDALRPGDDYPDYVVPLARAVAAGAVERGIAICGSGVGASVACNKVGGVRAALIHDVFSAHQGVEDDNMNVLCLGGRVTGPSLAWDLVRAFLAARFSGAARHRRRLGKVAALEMEGARAMSENPLQQLAQFGQSIWLDFIRRHLITSGELRRLIEEDGLKGVTSNPSIFDKSIAGSKDYDNAIRVLALEGREAEQIYERLTVEDIQMAADEFRPLYEHSDGRHGFVSLEVSPHLAHDTAGTVSEARRLWEEVDRPNVLIKVPGTAEGLPAIRQLIHEGINVNVTLLFGLPRYREVAEAYLDGIEARTRSGQAVERVASVASFFLSRIDVLVDPILEKRMDEGGREAEIARRLHGRVAIASAKMAYQIYKEIVGGERFRELVQWGARPQRVLWASTSTKNPAYSDVKYVDALIGPETINTVPSETLDAYRDHGDPAPRLEKGLDEAREVLRLLGEVGIDIDQMTQQLEDEGVEKFVRPFDSLLDTLSQKREAARREPVDRQLFDMGGNEADVRERLEELESQHFCDRLWRKDPSLWKSDPESQETIRNGLGWLHVAEKMEDNVPELMEFVSEVKKAGLRRVVHMGMGGSSLAPLVFQRSFEPGEGGLPLRVLDTTDPATVLDVERGGPLEETLLIVASKSGTTAEPRAFEEYFYAKLKDLKGDRAGENFVVITDPGTPLAQQAEKRGYRRAFLNFPDIGGRYSALSYFGMVPAALMGLDAGDLLARAERMAHACRGCVPVSDNPGLALGVFLGTLAQKGRDKVTFLASRSIATLEMWLEQLLAESTGKEETGLIPIAGEPLGEPDVYGRDRVFVHLWLEGDDDPALQQGVTALRKAGHPVTAIRLEDRADLAQEFFRWEIATATAGSILGINAFDQPNVQESKDNTNRLLDQFRKEGQLPREEPTVEEGPLRVYAPQGGGSVADALGQVFGQARAGDYVALMAYLTERPETNEALAQLRRNLRDGLHLATTLGYGPRFLHSTGQLHKGGPNTGLFLQLTADDAEDAQVPDQPYTFGAFKLAQAIGDLQALAKHGRRVVRVHLGRDVEAGLSALQKAVEEALAEEHVVTP